MKDQSMKVARTATAQEVAAYQAEMAPHRGNQKEVERIRQKHKMHVSFLGGSPRYTKRP